MKCYLVSLALKPEASGVRGYVITEQFGLGIKSAQFCQYIPASAPHLTDGARSDFASLKNLSDFPGLPRTVLTVPRGVFFQVITRCVHVIGEVHFACFFEIDLKNRIGCFGAGSDSVSPPLVRGCETLER